LIPLLLGPIRFFFFVLLLLVFILHHSLVSLILWNETTRLNYFLRSIQLTAKMGLWILNVKVSHEDTSEEIKNKLIVANHLSYLDVLILFSLYPSLFITSVEIKETFILGRICKLAGCFFVERRKSKHTPELKQTEFDKMKSKLSQGFNVFLFPEGTSSDGKGVLPFKGTFFQLAVDCGVGVSPMCLKYSGKNRDVVPWFGKMTFVDHLFKLCFQDQINAKLIVLPEIQASQRMETAERTNLIISEAYARH
jgi:1-acyl-sn-glycerol-3-phosphate acyltransferase